MKNNYKQQKIVKQEGKKDLKHQIVAKQEGNKDKKYLHSQNKRAKRM
jgi:hypothetical protein